VREGSGSIGDPDGSESRLLRADFSVLCCWAARGGRGVEGRKDGGGTEL